MKKQIPFALILLLSGCHSESTDHKKTVTDQSDGKSKFGTVPRTYPENVPVAEATLKSNMNGNSSDGSIVVKVTAGTDDSPLAPRYSPPGKGLELKGVEVPESLGFDGLETELGLGWPATKQLPIKMLVTRAAVDAAYTRLYIDSDANGKFDEEPIVAKSSESRGNIWSNFSATLKVRYQTEKPVVEDYPVALWIAVASVTEQPKVLRLSRRGFKTGDFMIAGQKISLVLSDSNNDAVFGEGDWWELKGEGTASKGSGASMRTVGDYHWLGETAYKLELDDATGNAGRITVFDPGKSREQDELDRDPYGADRKAVKAEKPLEFRHDVDTAILEAMNNKQRCFIKFETTWCGPCKTMTQHVFTAKDVVDASEGIVCIKVDGDERRDLVERYAVKGYPTGVLLAADGTEATRFLGYQKVVEMTKFFETK